MVETQSVQYFESDTKYTRVVAQDCDGLIRTPIKELQAQLGDDFMEIHRGVLVNRRFIHAIFRRGETMELEIRGRESRLKVSASHQHQFRSM
jgi:DNA-binding LytR/AlgR family response regulator